MTDKKLLLRVALKLFTGITVLWLIYIFLAGFFIRPEKPVASYRFDISSLVHKQSVYFSTGRRELLVIKQADKVLVFWASDPVYGCRLEYFSTYIKPVCIDIRYELDGYNAERDQWLNVPEFDVSLAGELVVY